MQLKFCGANRTVTGSCHLLILDSGFRILLDCGLYQGNDPMYRDFNEDWIFDPADVDAVILSHAHIDHSGRLPKLVKDGFNGPIYSTPATTDLCDIMLKDSAYIQENDAEFENKHRQRKGQELIAPLYTAEDVGNTMPLFHAVSYEQWTKVSDEVAFIFKDSGHILGSASITLKITPAQGRTFTLGFTGDIGRPDRPILKDPVPMPHVDYLITESTYGDRLHDQLEDQKAKLLEVITRTCVEQRGMLMIPAFSVGRTQEIVYLMDQLANEGKLPKIPVFVDSPLAINATEIFRAHPECFDDNLVAYMEKDPMPFGFSKLFYIRDVEDSKRLNSRHEPAVIISASGMMEGGRIRHHLFNHIADARNTLLIVGFAPEDTLGGRLRAGAEKIHLFGQEKEVKASVQIMDSFSAHGDQQEMLDYLDNQGRNKLKRIFLVHGEYDVQVQWREKLLEAGFQKVDIPTIAQEVRIG